MKCPHCGTDNDTSAAFCSGCGRAIQGTSPALSANEISGAEAEEAALDPSKCSACQAAEPEPGYELPLCMSCRAMLIRRPFPLWIHGGSVIVALALAIAFARFPSSLAAGIAYTRGQRAERAANFGAAAAEYRKVTVRFPGSTLAVARLGIASYRAGKLEEAARAFEQLSGRDTSKELAAEVNQVISEMRALAAPMKKELP